MSTSSETVQLSRADTMALLSERFWLRFVPERAHDIFLPQPIERQLIDGEVVQLIVYQAWYRNFSAYVLYYYTALVILLFFLASAGIWFYQLDFGISPVFAITSPFIAFAIWVLYAAFENFRYLQWRLVITNNRLIFATPQQDAWYLVDNIEMNGKPRIVDTNWSDSGGWRLIQMVFGARDVFISLQGLQFVEGTAKVKDALVMPDVDLRKVDSLKKIIFS